MVNGPQNWFDRRWPTYTKGPYRQSPDPVKNRPGYLVDRRYGMGAVPASPVVESAPRSDQPASALRTSNISSANLFDNPPLQMPPRSTQVLFPPKPDYELDSFKKDWSPRPPEIAWGADAENTYPLTGRHGHTDPALSPVNEPRIAPTPRTAPPKRALRDTTTRLESRRTLRGDAPNSFADNTQPSLALRQKETKEEMRPYMDLDDPFSPVFNALEIPGSSVRGLIKAYNNYNTKAYEHGGEDLLLPDIPGQIRNGPNDPSFVDAQQIARPGAGLAELTAIRALTDPLFLDSIPAIGKAAYGAVKAAPGAVKSAYGAAKAATGAVADAYKTAAPYVRAAPGAVADAYKAAAPYVKAAPGAVNDAANAIMFAPDRIADAVGGAYKSAAGSVGGAYNSAADAVADAARGAYNQPFMRSAAGAVGDAYNSAAGAARSAAGAVGDAAKRTADIARGLFSTKKATINPLGIDPATYARRTNPSITPDPRYAAARERYAAAQERKRQLPFSYKWEPLSNQPPMALIDGQPDPFYELRPRSQQQRNSRWVAGQQRSLFNQFEALPPAKQKPVDLPDELKPLAGQKSLFSPAAAKRRKFLAEPPTTEPISDDLKRYYLGEISEQELLRRQNTPGVSNNIDSKQKSRLLKFLNGQPEGGLPAEAGSLGEEYDQLLQSLEVPLSQNIVPAKRDSLINLGAGKPNLIVRNQPKQMRFNQPAPQAEVAAVEVAKAVETKKPPRKRKVPAAVPAETPQVQTPAGQQRNLFDPNEVVPPALQDGLPVGQPARRARVAPARRKQAKVPAAVPAETPQLQTPAALQGGLPVGQPAKRASLQYPEPPNTTGMTPSQLKEAYIKAVERGIETPEGRNLEAEAYKNAYRATPEGQKARSERILEKTIEGRAETIDRERFAERYSGLGTVTSPEMKQLPSGAIVDSGGREIPKQAAPAVATDPVATEAYGPPRPLTPEKRESLREKGKEYLASFPPRTQSQGRQFNQSEVWTGTQQQQDAVIKQLDSSRVPARQQIPGTAPFQTGTQPAKKTIAERMRPLDDLKWPLAKDAPPRRERQAQPDDDALNRLINSAERETKPKDLLRHIEQSGDRSGQLGSKSALGEVAPRITVGEDGFNQYVAEHTGTNNYIRTNNAMVSAIDELKARKGEDAVPANVMQTLQNMRREVGRTGSDKRLGEFNSVASDYGVRVIINKVAADVSELPTTIERQRINVGTKVNYSAMSNEQLSTNFTDFLRSKKDFDKAKDLFRAANREQREALYGLVPQRKRYEGLEAELRAIHKELKGAVAQPSTAQQAAREIAGGTPAAKALPTVKVEAATPSTATPRTAPLKREPVVLDPKSPYARMSKPELAKLYKQADARNETEKVAEIRKYLNHGVKGGSYQFR